MLKRKTLKTAPRACKLKILHRMAPRIRKENIQGRRKKKVEGVGHGLWWSGVRKKKKLEEG